MVSNILSVYKEASPELVERLCKYVEFLKLKPFFVKFCIFDFTEQEKVTMTGKTGSQLMFAVGLGTTLAIVTVTAALIIGCLIFKNSVLRHTCSRMRIKLRQYTGNDDGHGESTYLTGLFEIF